MGVGWGGVGWQAAGVESYVHDAEQQLPSHWQADDFVEFSVLQIWLV